MPPAGNPQAKVRPAKEKGWRISCSDAPVRSEYRINRLRLARNEQQANTESKSQILPSTPPAPKVRITVADDNRSYPPTTSNWNIRLLELKAVPEQLGNKFNDFGLGVCDD